MAWRRPLYSYENALRERGIANVDLRVGSAVAGFPLDNLFDNRIGFVTRTLNGVTPTSIRLDLGASPTTGYRRITIAGQIGFNANTFSIIEASDAAFTADFALLGITPTGAVDGKATGVGFFFSSQRYIKITQLFLGTHQLPEMTITKFVIISAAKSPEVSGAINGYRYNVSRLTQPNGVAPTVQHGARQRVIEYNYKDLTGDDLTAMQTFIDAVGMDQPFWLYPSSDSATDPAPLWMRFDREPVVTEGRRVPGAGTRSRNYNLKLLEVLD